ncbi:MAG: DUF4176 domain-containing protein [Clostridiaceae bacterium]|nr:DUF4176 domain-containing protein [Clostridiaceae bacterium]
MSEIKINNQELTERLLIQWLGKLKYLSDIRRQKIYNMACDYYSNSSFLFKINKAIVNNEQLYEDEINNIIYKSENNEHILIYKNHRMEFTYLQIKEIIAGMIDLLEKIYPLGTVVELKKQYLENIVSKDKIENARVVIVNRFIFHNEIKTYFQYAGVVYPLGMFEKEKVIQFTSSLIEKVIYEGYSDEQEETYVYLMKKELILEKKMHSFGFSTKEERENYEIKIVMENK